MNARNQPVGRLAAQIVPLLTGKYKPTYSPNYDCGDFVVVVNAADVKFTGKKMRDKIYYRHTGWPGGLKERKAKELMELKPEEVIRKAVLGMITRNNLRHKYIEPKLKIYRAHDHPHTKQLGEQHEPLPMAPRKLKKSWHPVHGNNEYLENITIPKEIRLSAMALEESGGGWGLGMGENMGEDGDFDFDSAEGGVSQEEIEAIAKAMEGVDFEKVSSGDESEHERLVSIISKETKKES